MVKNNNGRVDIAIWRQQLFDAVERIERKLDIYGAKIASNKTQIVIQWFILGALLIAIFIK